MYYRIKNGIAESKQLDINGFPGIWAAAEEGFVEGDLYDEDNGWSHPILTAEEIEAEARQWRDSELQSTDYIVPLTDHPDHAATITYRQELRDWPSTDAFPDTKPTKA
tara:strand:+ start:619 stop:942 length:324 start_codon:yes stop_codon:yes gene_type:complete